MEIVLKPAFKPGDDYLKYLDETSKRQQKAIILIDTVYRQIHELNHQKREIKGKWWARDAELDKQAESGLRGWYDPDDELGKLLFEEQKLGDRLKFLWQRHNFLIDVGQAYAQRIFDELRKWDRRKTDN